MKVPTNFRGCIAFIVEAILIQDVDAISIMALGVWADDEPSLTK